MSDIQGKDRENFKAIQEKLPKLKNLRGKHFLMRHGKIVYYYNSYNDAYSTEPQFTVTDNFQFSY